ncbi:MAG: hypothetical protein JOZ70_04670 [Pseudolabrys sp.]|nr:hypothetical protein [Pseudolabrys sp.]
MSRLPAHDSARQQPVKAQTKPAGPRAEYCVHRREDCWFIGFEGQEFGPYAKADEALLFAINAAHKLGEHGREAVVQKADSKGKSTQVWMSGDAYPPVL